MKCCIKLKSQDFYQMKNKPLKLLIALLLLSASTVGAFIYYQKKSEESERWNKMTFEERQAAIFTRQMKKAENGDADAQSYLGFHYFWGSPSNETEGVKWYRKAAEQGQASAQGMVGYATLRVKA